MKQVWAGREWLLAALAAVVLVAVAVLAPIAYVFLISEILIAVVYATSLNLLIGYSGMLSLGHSAYFALGAYTSGWLVIHGWPVALAMVAGPIMGGLGAASSVP